MKTIILYYSNHHGNTKKLVDAIQASDPENVEILDVTTAGPRHLCRKLRQAAAELYE